MVVEVPRYSDDDIANAVQQFVRDTNDYRLDTYRDLAHQHGWPSSATIISRLGTDNFATALLPTVRATQPGDVVSRWSNCPRQAKHLPDVVFDFSVEDFDTSTCRYCEVNDVKRAAYIASLPRFADAHPYAVKYLTDPGQADQRGGYVDFSCITCAASPTRWAPSVDTVPTCHSCRSVNGAKPGDLIERTGGGDPVQLEAAIASKLSDSRGLEVRCDRGIVIVQGAITVSNEMSSYPVPAIKPDIVLAEQRIAIELDQRGRWNSHATIQHIRQDIERDHALAAVGWRCLRIREPDMPTIGSWPWRYETTSTSPTTIANAIVETI